MFDTPKIVHSFYFPFFNDNYACLDLFYTGLETLSCTPTPTLSTLGSKIPVICESLSKLPSTILDIF